VNGELPPAAEGELVTKNSGPRAPRIGEKELAGSSLKSELAATAMSALGQPAAVPARVDGMNALQWKARWRLLCISVQNGFKKSLAMSGEVGSLAGDRGVSHERSRPADLLGPQDLWSRHARPHPPRYCGCSSCCALLAYGRRCRKAVMSRGAMSPPQAERSHLRRKPQN
jgi:hypothetical protein